MPAPTAAPAAPSPTDPYLPDPYLTEKRYVHIPLLEALRDPRTPDSFLRLCPITTPEEMSALVARRPSDPTLARYIVRMAATRSHVVRTEHLFEALELPDMCEWWLTDLAEAIPSWTADAAELASAFVRHPASSEKVAARVLTRLGGYGTGQPAELAAAAAGSLIPLAMNLLRRFGGLPQSVPSETERSSLSIAEDIAERVGTDRELRQVVAALGATWTGTLDELLVASSAVVRPAAA